jgi:anti-sigma regulatory factor (Ser/Thr protein kinase)
MNELSLYILDIAYNSIAANCREIRILIHENKKDNFLKIRISDNGQGMNSENLKRSLQPFYTTRTTRNVGLGLPLFKELCELCGGQFSIESEKGKGTVVEGTMLYDSIDRPEIGNIVETICTLIINENLNIVYEHIFNEAKFIFDLNEITKILNGVSIKQYEVMTWVKEYIDENIKFLHKEEKA